MNNRPTILQTKTDAKANMILFPSESTLVYIYIYIYSEKRNLRKTSPYCDSLFEKGRKYVVYNTWPVTFSFRDTRYRQMAQAIKWSNHGFSKRHPPISRQTAVLSGSRRNVLSSTVVTAAEVLPRDIRKSWEGLRKHAPDVFPQRKKNASDWDPATEVATLSALHVQSTFLDMSRSTTNGHIPDSASELRRAETTTYTARQEARLRAPLEQLQGNHSIVEQAAYQVAHRGPHDTSPNPGDEAGLIATSADSVLSHSQRWLLWTLNTPSRVKHAPSAHRMSCKKGTHPQLMS
jgi:hypothetical protein